MTHRGPFQPLLFCDSVTLVPVPSTPYQEGCGAQGLQRQPAALSVEAQLQALGRRRLLASTQTPVPTRDPHPSPRYLQGTVQLLVALG